jgi:predicted glycosyltransferase
MVRIAFYTHDTFGLGHTRRVAKLANRITQDFPNVQCLIITGLDKAGLIPLSPRVDFVRVPGVTKTGRESYRSRNMSVSLAELITIRSSIIQAAMDSFRAHIFIVDNVPLGMSGEIKEVLERLKKARNQIHTVLTMRDVLDTPEEIKRVWSQRGDYEALDKLYDLILIFGDSKIFDPVKAYSFPDSVSIKVRFCGYMGAFSLDGNRYLSPQGMPKKDQELITVTAGGGEDGFPLVKTYLESVTENKSLNSAQHLVLLGPYMPEKERTEIHNLYGNKPKIFVRDFVPDSENWIQSSELVVSMAGYNTIYEVLSLNVRSLVVPRIFPREEQLIRAKILSKMGLLEMIHPHKLSSHSICRRVMKCLASPKPTQDISILNFNGHINAIHHIKDLLPKNLIEGEWRQT